MSSTQGAGRANMRATAIAISGLLAAVGMLVMASMAMAGPDPLKGGTTTLNLTLPKKVKVKSPGGGAVLSGKTLTLTISGGSLDPTIGAGAVENGGSFVLKKGKKKVTVSEVKTTFGGVYAGGNISAKLGKKTSTLADLTGGTVSRNGFGGKVDGSAANVTKGGAKALNKALGLKKKKKNGKKNKNRFKKGKSLGSASTITEPKTVEVISGTAISHPGNGFFKLAYTCPGAPNATCYGKGVNPNNSTVAGGGITVSNGATYAGPGQPVIAPVAAPSDIAPDASAGSVRTGGAIKVTKTITAAAYGGSCPQDAGHWPVGNFVQFTNTTNDFTNKNVLVDLTLKSPFLGFPQAGGAPFGTQIPSAGIDMAGATVASNAAAHTVTIDGFNARNVNAAQIGLINGTFGPGAAGCGVAANDAAIGDALFKVDLHLVTH